MQLLTCYGSVLVVDVERAQTSDEGVAVGTIGDAGDALKVGQ